MNSLTEHIVGEITRHGADLVGVGSLLELPEDVRCGLPIGISVAVKYPKEVIRGIAELPTQEYKNWYDALNKQLDLIVTLGAEALINAGYAAIAQTREYVGNAEEKLQSALPHKTVATRAGLGWIGKCALLVTQDYGSMIRFSSILTNAPLTTAAAINQSKCGNWPAQRKQLAVRSGMLNYTETIFLTLLNVVIWREKDQSAVSEKKSLFAANVLKCAHIRNGI